MGHDFLSSHIPHTKLLGTTTGIIATAVAGAILLVLLLAPVFWADVRPEVRRPGQPRPQRPPRAVLRGRTAVPASEGQGPLPLERPEDRHVRPGGSHHGRPSSWAVVAVMTMAFITGGVAIIIHAYWLLWTCVGVVVLGGLAGLAVGIMNDTIEWGSSEAAQADDGAERDGQGSPVGEGGRAAGLPGEPEHRALPGPARPVAAQRKGRSCWPSRSAWPLSASQPRASCRACRVV
jgi:hypothetical protein